MSDFSIKYEVSVILTVYNREHYLKRSIDSLINQSFSNWELIAIDDGSTDNSLNVLRSYEEDFPNIKVLHQENQRIAQSRNRGIFFSAGRYITFLDSDDEYEKSHLLKRAEFLDEHTGIDLLFGGVKVIGNQFVRDKDNPQNFIHLSNCFIGGTFFGKRKVFIELGGFKDLEYSEDSDLIIRAKNKFKIQKFDHPTYIYHRELTDSLTNSYVPQ
ncbi:MAG: glycosyltransferase family A protein [Ignavibacteriaceae bacterium]